MADNKDTFTTITPKMVLGQLFKSRDIMHIVHLRTTSLSTHKTAEAYYTSLLILVDLLAEVHFGVIGKKDIDEIPTAKYIDPTMHLNDLSYYLTGNRRVFTTSHEQSILDDIMTLISKTQFLLTLE